MFNRHKIILPTLLTALLGVAASTSGAASAAPGPGWALMGNTVPTNLPPGGEGIVELYVYNVGAGEATSSPVVTDTLPPGLTPVKAQVAEGRGSCGTASNTITCELNWFPESDIRDVQEVRVVKILVHVDPNAAPSVIDGATVVGGGALNSAKVSFPITISGTAAAAGFAHANAWLSNADGTIDTQAGSHPYDLVVAFALNNVVSKGKVNEGAMFFENEEPAGGQLRDVNVNLPPGLVGSPNATPQCTRQQLVQEECPLDSQIGEDKTTIQGLTLAVADPIYNMVPPPGIAAQFAFLPAHNTVFLNSGVRTGTDNGITTHTDTLPEKAITFSTATIWGIPAAAGHDAQRVGYEENGEYCLPFDGERATCPSNAPKTPLLSLPTSCHGPVDFSAEYLGTWENEHLVAPPIDFSTQNSEGTPVGFTGCERLQTFYPAINIAPDTTYADTPAGLSVTVKMPLETNPEGLATPGLRGTTVVLPEGIAINPGQATGLVACQPSQEAIGNLPDGEANEGPTSCPPASKVGTVEVESPLLHEKMEGDVYILQKEPPNLELLIAASAEGVNLKLVGQVHLDETTGQLTTTFDETPDIPFTTFKLNFSGGAQAALATPTKCGTYGSSVDFTPWSTPFIEDALDTSRFQIATGPNGSPCQWPLPFAPSMIAGATTDQAGGYTSFTMLLQRGDGQQRIKTLSFETPEGLLGMIAKVTPCPEPQAAQGTCSAASQIGHTVVGAGPGPYPFYIPQAGAPPAPIYLTGPYDGAPFGLSIVVPLIAGPFNLGTEVVRGRLDVDPHTSQVTITTNPLPLTEKGIPDDLRLINAVIDRPEFMFNPTSCAPMSFSGTATSTEGVSAPLSSHFQMGSCQALKFQPNFKVSTSGKTSRKNGASLNAKIVYPVGNLGFNQASSQSNIKTVKVDLPKQLPSRLPTLQKACTSKQFEANPAGCPSASKVGHAKAITPVLPVPLEGPAYFVSHGGESFPNLIVVLQGDNVTVDLVGDTFINEKTNITSSTFKQVPDVPIQSFELNLPQGPYSALAANTNLCKVKGGLKMPTIFTGQNNATIKQNTQIAITGCAKAKHKAKNAKHHKGKSRGKK